MRLSLNASFFNADKLATGSKVAEDHFMRGVQLKIALVVHSNILTKIDGMTSYYKRLCQYAPARHHRLDVFMQAPDKAEILQKKTGRFFLIRVKATFQPLPEAYLSLNPFQYIRLFWCFQRIFKKEKYSCLQIASAHPMSLSAIAAAKRLGIPVIGSYHTLLPEYAGYWSIRRFESLVGGKLVARGLTAFVAGWTRLVYGAADIILVPTAKVKYSLEKKFRRKRIEVIGRGVESDFFKPRKTTAKQLTALYVGRVSVEKDLAKLAFFRRYPDIRLKIVGDGKDVAVIRKLLPNADFKGRLQGRHLASEYRGSDFFVFPSKTDAYANAVSEALCSGLPVVAFDAAGVEDRVKDGVNGFLVHSDAEFENAVLKLKDSNLREKMSKMARQTALGLKWEIVLERQIRAFETAQEERRRKLRKFFPILRQVLYAFNFSHALLGSARMGFYVFLANASAGLAAGAGAGIRQSLISFIMVGINTSFFEFLYFRSRALSIILPSMLTTTVGTTIHMFSGTPNIATTAGTILGLALFNFIMLSEIHRRHKTISPWELTKIFGRYLANTMQKLRPAFKNTLTQVAPPLQAMLARNNTAKLSK